MATTDWIELFLATKVVHLECGMLDHKPIIIMPKGIQKKRRRPWRFEQMWLEDPGCKDIVESAWGRTMVGGLMEQVEGKIQECQEKLTQWSWLSFGNITRFLKEKKKKKRSYGKPKN